MTGIAIRIDDADLARMGHALEPLLREADRAHDLMDAIGGALVQSTHHRFDDEQAGPDGARWRPSLRAIREGGQTLVRRGHLHDSVTHAASDRSVAVGTNAICGRIHQLGGTIRPRGAKALAIPLPGGGVALKQSVTLPARPYLGISADDEAEIGEIVTDRLRAAIRRGASA